MEKSTEKNRFEKSHPRDLTEKGRIELRDRLVAEARNFNLLSNVFMSVALKDRGACRHVLRILTGIPDLDVVDVRTQYSISKVSSHDAVLDVLAEDGEGRLYDIEIQRAETIDHARRTRFYGSMMDSEFLMKGKTYAELPDSYIIYISETDLWHADHTCYPVEKFFRHTEIPYADGQHVLYVNAAVDDGSETAKLMQYFKTSDPEDDSQGDLSKWVHFLKSEEGGYEVMCEVSEKIYREGEQIGLEKGLEKGEQAGLQKTARRMYQKGYPSAMIADALGVSEQTVQEWTA